MKRLMNILITLGLTIGLFGAFVPTTVGAINVFQACDKNDTTAVCNSATGTGKDNVNTLVRNVIQALLFVIGIVSVVMIIIGGIRYTLSNGDASQIKSAKDTVLYAVIGLIVAMLAYAIVGFVVAQF